MARFFRRGVTRARWVATIADTAMRPTRAELDAAVLLPSVAALDGWSPIETAVVNDRLCGVGHGGRRGRPVLTESTLTFWADPFGLDVRQTLTPGQVGHVAILDGGLLTGALLDVFAVEVGTRRQERDLTAAASFTVPFAITRWVLDYPTPAEV